jgi:DNA repair protein RecO (recombination protein O)
LLIKWEMGFLAELGFGIDISKCVVSSETDNLIYVSPKSGKAVSKEIGNPYKDKLLKLPSFLIDNKKPSKIDVINGFLLTGFFLNKDVYEPLGLKMPNSRDRIVAMVRDSHLT